MKFEKISRSCRSYYISSREKFQRFYDDFGIVGVEWSEPRNISASYFLRLLKGGSSERARGYGRYSKKNDEWCDDLHKYYLKLLDHGAMWKLKDGRVICTAMPYETKESIVKYFEKMVNEFNYPSNVVMKFLDEKYRYRSNGSHMILIYYDNKNK